MKRLILSFICFIILGASIPAYSALKIYLIPRYVKTSQDIFMQDIAECVGDSGKHSIISQLPINRDYYADGYIDREEIYELTRSLTKETVFIYGSSVKIQDKESVSEVSEPGNVTSKYIGTELSAGTSVTVVVKKGAIRLEVPGKLVQQSTVGERVMVRMGNNRKVFATLVDTKTVHVEE